MAFFTRSGTLHVRLYGGFQALFGPYHLPFYIAEKHLQRHQNRHKTGRHMHTKFQPTGQDGVAEFHQQSQHHHGHRLPVHALCDGIVQGIESHHHGVFVATITPIQTTIEEITSLIK